MPPRSLSRRKLLAATATVGAAITAGCLSEPLFEGNPGEIHSPARTKVGDSLKIQLTNFEPQTDVSLAVSATDTTGQKHTGSWSLQTDASGASSFSDANISNNTPQSTWYGSDQGRQLATQSGTRMILQHLSPKGLFTSSPNFLLGEQRTVTLSLKAQTGLFGQSTTTGSQSRMFLDPGVTRQSVSVNGLVGWLYQPSTPGPHPGVLTLHGALASIPHRLSKLLATHGYATLALQYFNAPKLPSSLKNIPLEYFDRAIHWLTNRPTIRDTGIGLIGISRGVEAALLTAANYKEPTTVIGYSGGSVIGHGVTGVPPSSFISQPAWTRNGSPVATSESISTVYTAINAVNNHRCDVAALPDAIRSRVSETVLEQVLVPVEEINGPVLLLAGADDQQWPSVPASSVAIDRLRKHGHSSPYGLQAYCNTGHIFAMPYADYTGAPTNDENGGSPKANTRAAADSWPVVLEYLKRS